MTQQPSYEVHPLAHSHSPGSLEAIRKGCTCPGVRMPKNRDRPIGMSARDFYWEAIINTNCPLHNKEFSVFCERYECGDYFIDSVTDNPKQEEQ